MLSAAYQQRTIPLPDDPLSSVARLASAWPHDDFVVYENGAEWTFAGGALAEVVADRSGIRRHGPDPVEFPWSQAPLARVQELLDGAGVPQWRAYGWAAFELPSATRGAMTHEQRVLHLTIPRISVRLRDGHAHIASVDPVATEAVEAALFGRNRSFGRPTEPIRVRERGVAEYRRRVDRVIRAIRDGSLEKVILSRKIPVHDDIDLVGTYLAGRRGNTPARSFLLRLGGIEATGFSPHSVLDVTADGCATTHALAGTRALAADDDEHNQRLRANLLRDPKEVYEHAISVKAVIDDLSRVCAKDSVAVAEFMAVHERGSVQHLSSRITGQLAPGHGTWDAFGAVFPAVTASGVPKKAAFRCIRENEDGPRQLYAGSVLTVGHDGTMDAALVLRGVYRQNGATWLQAGAGIIGQSDPDREFEETCEKLDSVVRFLVPAQGS
ncbi:salicylate synthase [Micromonospora andamanensis]|uniref:salicylate synthase n=1 Tax=Micromonospora andamanensis TaxID=1287068 RepID=UPI00195006DD|nr:salicylate synthase [Micromonospora andamanensis]GIJ41674.1 salicylate synthase [Micromonospora andamanensis]